MFIERLVPHVICIESESGAAIIPAALDSSGNRVELLGELLFDYRDVLHFGSLDVLHQAWRELAQCNRTFQLVSLTDTAARERWGQLPVLPFSNAPQVSCAVVDESAFRMAHSRLGRQMRRLQKQGVTLHCYSGTDSAIVRRLYENKRANFSGSDDNVFHDLRRCEFMVAAAALEADDCAVYTLESDPGDLVAGLVTFRDQEFRRFYTIYFHPQWARYSPGLALLYEVTARSLGEGLSCDYMTGEYAYKLRLANASRPLYRVEVSTEVLAKVTSRVPAADAA